MAIEVKLKPATFRHIEAELYSYKDTVKEIKKLREEIIYSTPIDENIGAGSNSYRTPGRPTERIATRLTTHKTLRNLEEIVHAIDNAYDSISENHQKMLRLKYWSNNAYTWQGIADKCHVHPNTMTKMRKEVISLIADKIGWR
jgi:RinA family phage transcriptional activator